MMAGDETPVHGTPASASSPEMAGVIDRYFDRVMALFSPAALINAPMVLTAGKHYPIAIPVIVTWGVIVVLTYAAAEAFRRKEI